MANFCKKCGSEIPEGAKCCPQCGTPLNAVDGASTGLKVLSVLIPIAGWIMYFIFKDENIVKARECSKFAWIGFAINAAFIIIGGLE